MAKTLGEAGRYTSNEALKKARQSYLIVLITMFIIGLFEGLLLFYMFSNSKPLWFSLLTILMFPIGYSVYKYGLKRIYELEKLKLDYRKGAAGEDFTVRILENLSDDYTVINGLSTDAGDIDHVVVGPTGIYLIDTKNWKGVVKVDDKGELLRNEKPTDKQEIRNFQIRVMEIRKRFLSLCNIDDVYFQPLFVFPAARVEAKWGTTHNVHCMTDEKLLEYITDEKKTKKKIPKDLIEKYKKGFTAMARMDEKF